MDGPANVGSTKGRNNDPTSYDGIKETIDFRLIFRLLEHLSFLNVMPPRFTT